MKRLTRKSQYTYQLLVQSLIAVMVEISTAQVGHTKYSLGENVAQPWQL
jgi:hypothetical protein